MLETIGQASSVLVTVQIAKLVYGWGKYWYTKKSTAEKLIEIAERIVVLDEKIHDAPGDLDVNDALEEVDLQVTAGKVRRRVRHHGLFRNYLVMSARAKFGCPGRTGANVLVVRKFLYDLCVEHGVLARHIVENLDFAVEVVFMPSTADLLAKAVRHTKRYEERTRVRDELGGLPSMP